MESRQGQGAQGMGKKNKDREREERQAQKRIRSLSNTPWGVGPLSQSARNGPSGGDKRFLSELAVFLDGHWHCSF